MELCGGTHVNSTGQIGTFKIISDHSVSSGVKGLKQLPGKRQKLIFQNKMSCC